MEAFFTIVGFLLLIFIISWMLQMLKLSRQNRILNSMLLKVILKIGKERGVDIDIKSIQKEVESKL